MKDDTAELIRRLSGDARAVRPLPRASIRTATWLGLSAVYIVLILLVTPAPGLPSRISESWFLLEQTLALVVGLSAAWGAFATVIPRADRWSPWWLTVPPAAWLVVLGRPCLLELMEPGSVSLSHDLSCLPFIILLAAVPATTMAFMLRRGAPLTPRLTVALGALASTGLANMSLRLFYPEDVTLMLVVWHVGGIFALSAVAALTARHFLDWRSLIGTRSET